MPRSPALHRLGLPFAALGALSLAAAVAALAQANAPLEIYAAGSLRAALSEIAQAYERAEPGSSVHLTFGASGLLLDRLVGGARADVFASANMEHPLALAVTGRTAPVRRFARNALCVLAAPNAGVTADNVIDKMLAPTLKLGTSTPKADPAGDYTWQMFERIEQQGRPGALATLSAKALQLTGGPQSPAPPEGGQSLYGMLITQGRADLFVVYCTAAASAVREQPQLKSVAVPAAVNVGASYGITTLAGAPPAADRFIELVLGPVGQGILARFGFAPP